MTVPEISVVLGSYNRNGFLQATIESVRAKVKKGKQLLSEWTEDDYWSVLKKIFDKYARKMRCWKDS